MGAVYRARDLHFPSVNRVVALKEMVNQARDPLVRDTIVRNFEREANILATLDHPAVPRIYDYFTSNERSYLILEFINGKDLEALLNENEGWIAPERVIQWGIELCDVLSYLHSHSPEPIIFRDMKPSNVMINSHDHIVLIDFGIAKSFQYGQRGTMIGTEGYSPPEQYRGEATPQADIYALGATLHHVLARRDPRLEAPFSFAERPIRAHNPHVSLELETVVMTALQYNPKDRFQSASAMKEALISAARQTGMLARPGYLKTSLYGTGSDIQPLWTFACEDEIRGAPAFHNGIVYTGSYDNNLYALKADTGDFLWKYPTDGGVVSRPVVYESSVYFGSEDKRVHVVNARNGRVNWTYYTDGPVRSSPRITEGHILIGSDDCHLHAINSVSGRKAWQVNVSGPVRSSPAVSQDMVYVGTENGDLYCVDFRGSIKWHYQARRAITSSPLVEQGILYFGSMDTNLYALDARTGWTIWRFRLGKGTISSPALFNDLVYTGAVDGNIYCIDAKSAKEVWRFGTEHQVTGSPIVYKDAVYCGSVDGHLYCLEYRTGRLRWKLRTGGPITGAPLAADDIIYVGSVDHRIYAVQI
jgi:outer membrane protein assembly factor BamB